MAATETQTISVQNYTLTNLESDYTADDRPKRLSVWHMHSGSEGFCVVETVDAVDTAVLSNYGTDVTLNNITKDGDYITVKYRSTTKECKSLTFKFHQDLLIGEGTNYSDDKLGHSNVDNVEVKSGYIGFSYTSTNGDDYVETISWYSYADIEGFTSNDKDNNLSSWLLYYTSSCVEITAINYVILTPDSFEFGRQKGEDYDTSTTATAVYTIDDTPDTGKDITVTIEFDVMALVDDPSGGGDYASDKLGLSDFDECRLVENTGLLEFKKDVTA